MIIPGSNGLIHLSIPIVGGRNVKIEYKDVLIDHSGDWRRDHIRTIKSVYGKSAWGFQYFDSLDHIFSKKEKFLYDWNLVCIDWICSRFKIDLKIVERDVVDDMTEIVDLTDLIIPSNFQMMNKKSFKYFQVFEDKIGFQPNVSSIDLLMNEGPSGLQKIN